MYVKSDLLRVMCVKRDLTYVKRDLLRVMRTMDAIHQSILKRNRSLWSLIDVHVRVHVRVRA